MDVEICPECKVPKYFTGEHRWLDSGIIVQTADETSRPFFVECENMDPLFHNIDSIIGVPIEQAVIAAKRRNVRTYIESVLPEGVEAKLRAREIDWQPVNDSLRLISRLIGGGRYEVKDYRFEGDDDDFIIETITDPLSIPFSCGTMAAAFEIFFARELGVMYKVIDPETLEITCYPSDHPEEFKGRLHMDIYEPKPGDVQLERCATCGGPSALKAFAWDLERGIIRNDTTTRRLAMVGSEIDPIFKELEEELGESIPRAVIEAQRLFVKTGFYTTADVGDESDIRTQFALRGMGNLREIKMGRRGVRLHIENAGLHLLICGLTQGLYEMAFNVESDIDWEFSADGDLKIEVNPRNP